MERGARQVGALAQADALVGGQQPAAEYPGRDAHRDVDEEDPVPVDGLGEHAAGKQADRAARRGECERVDADRLRLLPGLREYRHDHAEDDGRGHRAADALYEPRRDQPHLALRQAAQRRGAGEQREPGQEDGPATQQVTQAPGEEQQPAERDQVPVHDPREAGGGEPEVVLDRRKYGVH